MPITTITAIDALKLALKDRGAHLLSDDEYERVLLEAIAPEATYPARRVTAGYWVVPMAPLCLFAASFAQEPGADYNLSCGGFSLGGAVSIKLTAGTDVRESIDVTGCRVNFARAMELLFVFLADHRALEVSQQIHGGGVSVEGAREKLLKQAEIYRGVVAV